ncbi:hypothetical protein ACFE04_022732 [Oxalis oulophora]
MPSLACEHNKLTVLCSLVDFGGIGILADTPISLAVPVTNGTTFAATAVVGMLLGEETRVGPALIGEVIISQEPYVCVPNTNTSPVNKCDGCFTSTSSIKKCSACHTVYYDGG